AGSVSGTSAWGAHAACRGVLSAAMSSPFIKDFSDATADEADAIMRWLFDNALNWVRERSEHMALALPQLATTLCVAVARPGFAVFGQIGDGIIAAECGGVIDTYLIEDKAEYANATWFIQSPGAFEESFRTAVSTDLTALALSTDGMSYKITNIATGEPYEP
ncbi:MAG: protein phosphatase 2C domain-containing protein, partial [Mycobacterium sp.]